MNCRIQIADFPLSQRIRSIGISWTLSANEWVWSRVLTTYEPSSRLLEWLDELRNKIGWWISDRLLGAFSLFYRGSDEEIEAVYSGEIPRRYMNGRQRLAGRNAALHGLLFEEVICIHCETEPLLISDETNLCAECRALHPEILLEDRKS